MNKFNELCESTLNENRGMMIAAIKEALKQLGVSPSEYKNYKFGVKKDKNYGSQSIKATLNGETVMFDANWDKMIELAKKYISEDPEKYGVTIK